MAPRLTCPGIYCRRAVAAAVVLAALAACVSADSGNVDLPVATEGTHEWAATVAKAMSFGAKDQGTAMSNLQSFQSKVTANLQKQVRCGTENVINTGLARETRERHPAAKPCTSGSAESFCSLI